MMPLTLASVGEENMIKKADKRNIHENLEKLGAEKIPMHRSDWTENK